MPEVGEGGGRVPSRCSVVIKAGGLSTQSCDQLKFWSRTPSWDTRGHQHIDDAVCPTSWFNQERAWLTIINCVKCLFFPCRSLNATFKYWCSVSKCLVGLFTPPWLLGMEEIYTPRWKKYEVFISNALFHHPSITAMMKGCSLRLRSAASVAGSKFLIRPSYWDGQPEVMRSSPQNTHARTQQPVIYDSCALI